MDAVLISTPDHLHVTIAKAALEAGKHVYLEKPTLHRWEDRTILTRPRRSKASLQCGMQQRSGAHYMRAKQEIFAGKKLGQVLFARAVWHNFPWQQRFVPDRPSRRGSIGISFLARRRKFPTRPSATAPGAIFPIMEPACWPTS